MSTTPSEESAPVVRKWHDFMFVQTFPDDERTYETHFWFDSNSTPKGKQILDGLTKLVAKGDMHKRVLDIIECFYRGRAIGPVLLAKSISNAKEMEDIDKAIALFDGISPEEYGAWVYKDEFTMECATSIILNM